MKTLIELDNFSQSCFCSICGKPGYTFSGLIMKNWPPEIKCPFSFFQIMPSCNCKIVYWLTAKP